MRPVHLQTHGAESRVKVNFSDEEDVAKFATEILKSISADEWNNERKRLANELRAIIAAGGDYL